MVKARVAGSEDSGVGYGEIMRYKRCKITSSANRQDIIRLGWKWRVTYVATGVTDGVEDVLKRLATEVCDHLCGLRIDLHTV